MIEEKIQSKEREITQLKEFNEKNTTNFVRNVRPRLRSLFPNVYKGKDGNQKLLRDVRYLKISCEGKIPPVTKDDRENFEKLLREGKEKVVETIGIMPESENFLQPAEPKVSQQTCASNTQSFTQHAPRHAHANAQLFNNTHVNQPVTPICTSIIPSSIEPHVQAYPHQMFNMQTYPFNPETAVCATRYTPQPYFFPNQNYNFVQGNTYPLQYLQTQHPPTIQNTLIGNPTPAHNAQIVENVASTSTPEATNLLGANETSNQPLLELANVALNQ